MTIFKDKLSSLIGSQVPDFVLDDHPKFLQFLKTYYTFMEAAELSVTSVQTTDGIQLETETQQFNILLLNGSRIDSDITLLDEGDKLLLESSSFGKFTRGETIQGQTSKATSTVFTEDLNNNRLFIVAQDKFIIGETILGLSSNASAIVNDYRPNPVNNIQELLNFRDPDKVIASFLNKFRNEFLATIPENLAEGLNKRNLIKNIKSLYSSKGTKVGHEIFFRLLFNIPSETLYPSEQMLRVSDGIWDTKKVIRTITVAGDTSKLVGRTITGQTSGTTAIVENILKFQVGADEVTEFTINENTFTGNFIIGEEIRGTPFDDSDIFIKSNITGLLTTPNITNAGSLYLPNDDVTLIGGGTGALLQVENVGSGKITDLIIDNGGLNYSEGDVLTFNNTGTNGTSAAAIVSIVNGGFTLEDSNSLTEDHIVLETATAEEGVFVGNKFVQEIGTGVRDITDFRIQNPGYNYFSLPTVTITSNNGLNAVIRPYGDEIGKLLSIKISESGKSNELAPSPTLNLPVNLLVINKSGNFLPNDTVTALSEDGSTVVTATVISFNSVNNILKVKNTNGTFSTAVNITSSSGGLAKITVFNKATATISTSAVFENKGNYVNQRGHTSETTMRIQDSRYYQDFSYVLKVGRTINDWRKAFKQTVHSAGYFFQGQLNIELNANVQINSPVAGIISDISDTPIFSILNTLFSTIFGRRLGTESDGTSLRSQSLEGVPLDLNTSTIEHFSSNTRDVTLFRENNYFFVLKENVTLRNNTTRFGRAVSGPTLYYLQKYLLNQQVFSTQVTLEQLGDLRVFGTQNTDIDGELVQFDDFNYLIKTNLAIPSQLIIFGEDTFDETVATFDSNSITFDAAP
jgi:hypothetical protein